MRFWLDTAKSENKMMDDAWAQRGDDIEDADRRDEVRAEYAEKALRHVGAVTTKKG